MKIVSINGPLAIGKTTIRGGPVFFSKHVATIIDTNTKTVEQVENEVFDRIQRQFEGNN